MMIKRVISTVLIIVLAFNFAVSAASNLNDIVSMVISKALQFSSEDRGNLVSITRSFINSDSGIDVLINSVNNYSPNSDSLFNSAFGSLLDYVDKDTVVKALKILKIADENVRRDYLVSFENRDTLKLSDEAMKSIQYFIDKACNKYNGLQQIMLEDSITAEVIANLLKAVSDNNEGKPLFADDLSNKNYLDIYTVSRGLKNRINNYLSDTGRSEGLETILNTYLVRINENLSDDERLKIKTIGREVGFYTPSVDIIAKGSDGGTAYQNDEFTLKYSIVKSKEAVPYCYELNGATVIEVSLYRNGIKQEFGNLDKSCVIAVPVMNNSTVVFKITDTLENIKYSVVNDNVLYIKINSTGYYGISYAPKYFKDNNGWGSYYIESLYNKGVINGKSDGVFAPEDNITREEFVKLIIELLEFNDDTYYANFTDIKSDEWYYRYVATAYKNGIISGVGNNMFGTGEYITRQDICKIIANAAKIKNISFERKKDVIAFLDERETDSYAKDSVNMMYSAGIISGDENGYFYPQDYATRQECAKIIYSVLELLVMG